VQDHEWGYGGSPVLEGDLCILNFGPGPRSFLIAVDKRTGKKAWQFDVPPPATTEGPGASQNWIGSWSTPVVLDTGSRRELVATLPGGVFGFDPATGKELWHCNGLNPLVYTNPLLGDGIIVGLGGFNGYGVGVRAGGEGDVTATHRLWQSKQAPQRIGSGMFVGGRIFSPSDAGVIECLDPKTGDVLWKERPQVPGGHATSSWSSLARSGDRLYLLTQASDTIVFRAGEKYEQLAANALDDGMCNSSPAVSDGEIFIRTHAHLWCIAGKK
jgi:outer membrane protein assembly factor BamB